jgi:hypothetical protein
MSHAAPLGVSLDAATDSRTALLRRRIGWLCHALRVAAVLWVLWIVAMVVAVWSNKAGVIDGYTLFLGETLGKISDARYAAAFAIAILDCGFAALVAFCISKLATTYLSGHVFTPDAAVWLRRIGLAGVIAVAGDVIARIAVVAIFAGRLVIATPHGFILLPQDLLHLILGVFVLALAHIFKVATEIADDHAKIV